MRRLFFFLSVFLLPAAANATSFHYDFEPGAFFYVHEYGGPNSTLIGRFDLPVTSGYIDADDILGTASLYAVSETAELNVNLTPRRGIDVVHAGPTGDLLNIGASMAGTLIYNGEIIPIGELGYSQFISDRPGQIRTYSGGEFNGGRFEWGVGFSAVRTEAAAVPEPASAALLGLALLRLRRRRA